MSHTSSCDLYFTSSDSIRLFNVRLSDPLLDLYPWLYRTQIWAFYHLSEKHFVLVGANVMLTNQHIEFTFSILRFHVDSSPFPCAENEKYSIALL